jgi:hypothetical protein
MSYTNIGDIIIEVDIIEDDISFDIIEDHIDAKIIEDHIDVNIKEENLNINLVEDVFSINLVEDHIDVTLDDGCICPPSGGDTSLTEVYNCDGTLNVGDLVYPSRVINKYVFKATNNNTDSPIIGIVTKILSATTVEVSHIGFFNVSEILEKGKKIFVSENGSFTSNVIMENYLQVLGVAISENRVYFNPELRRCKRLSLI